MYRKTKHIAYINIATFKNQDVLVPIIKSAVSSNISVDLSKLKKSPKAFSLVLAANIDDWAKSGALNEILKVYDKDVRTPELDRIINNGIIKLLSNAKARKPNKYTVYKLGKEIPKAIKSCIGFMDDKTKSEVLSKILDKQDNFYSYARKLLAQTAAELANSDKESIEVLNSFYKVMEKKAFFDVVGKVTGGMSNPSIKKILDKTKKFHVCRYTKSEIKSDSKRRVELLKDIARTTSSAKNLNFMITFKVEDLKELASVMRFNFLQWYFKPRFRCAARNYNRPEKYKLQLNQYTKGTGLDKIEIDTMTDDELTELLFGVGLKKNDEVTKFIDKYKHYKKVEAGIPLDRKEISKTFGRYGYYYYR
jgi:hypothetical protein